MARINLLPWRDELRKQRQRDFFIFAGSAAFATVLGVVFIHFFYSLMIQRQEENNAYLREEIKKVEAQIKEIEELERQKAALIARMQVIDQLQKNRPEIVHMFDELVRMMPEGMYLTSLVQKGDLLTIEGNAQSNARISALMRSLDGSAWFTEPNLEIIQSKNVKNGKGESAQSFKLRVKQKTSAKGEASGSQH